MRLSPEMEMFLAVAGLVLAIVSVAVAYKRLPGR